MRRFAWITALAWLAGGVHLLARDGADRVRKDAAIARVDAVHRRRGLAWDAGELGRQVAGVERTATELRAVGHERVLLVTRPNTNPFVSVAVHVLFPTHVVIRMREGRSLAEVRAEARREGAGAILFHGSDGDWTVLSVEPDAGSGPEPEPELGPGPGPPAPSGPDGEDEGG